MPHDPARVAETKSWFAKAASDLRAASHELTAVPPLTDDIVFHAQQAAEKAMKGYLSWHDQPFRKTHDLAEIGRQCAAMDVSLEPLLKLRREPHRIRVGISVPRGCREPVCRGISSRPRRGPRDRRGDTRAPASRHSSLTEAPLGQ